MENAKYTLVTFHQDKDLEEIDKELNLITKRIKSILDNCYEFDKEYFEKND